VASQLGLTASPLSALAGGTPAENAAQVESVLAGEPGPRRDVVLLNAAAALLVAGRVDTLADGIPLAAATIDSGAATALLARLRSGKTRRDQAKAEAARTMEATPA
jgi:anthranilate phosphoribosyltransferase